MPGRKIHANLLDETSPALDDAKTTGRWFSERGKKWGRGKKVARRAARFFHRFFFSPLRGGSCKTVLQIHADASHFFRPGFHARTRFHSCEPSCVRRIRRSLENFYKIPSSTNFHFYEKKENIRGAFFSSCRKLFENYCRIFEDNRNLLLGHPVCIWRRIGKRKAMVREKERGRVRLGYVTGLLLRFYRDWGIERRLARTRRHGNRWRSESESGEPAATDFHPRKNMGERVVITPTRRAMCTH